MQQTSLCVVGTVVYEDISIGAFPLYTVSYKRNINGPVGTKSVLLNDNINM